MFTEDFLELRRKMRLPLYKLDRPLSEEEQKIVEKARKEGLCEALFGKYGNMEEAFILSDFACRALDKGFPLIPDYMSLPLGDPYSLPENVYLAVMNVLAMPSSSPDAEI